MRRIVALLLVCSLIFDVSAMAAVSGKSAMYVAGTVPAYTQELEGEWHLGAFQVIFTPRNKAYEPLYIPYGKIETLEYGQKVGRRIGLAVGTAVLSPAGLLFLMAKKRKHYLTIGYRDDGQKPQDVVFELAKGIVPEVLETLEAKSGKSVQYDRDALSAENIDKEMYAKGKVFPRRDSQRTAKGRLYNFKLAATWLTPDLILAQARLIQHRSMLSPDEARALVTEAESAGPTVILLEIDSRDPSVAPPPDWEIFLRPKSVRGRTISVNGIQKPELRQVKALAGTTRRNHVYDRHWFVFPLTNEAGAPLFAPTDLEAELVVRIYDSEGRVVWRIPESVRTRTSTLLRSSK